MNNTRILSKPTQEFWNNAFNQITWPIGFLLLTVFFIPLSPTLKSVFIILSVSGLLLTQKETSNITRLVSQPWCRWILLFFLLVLIESIWSPATLSTRLVLLEKYSKLLYLPILSLGFQKRIVRQLSIYFFISAMVLTCAISLLKAAQLIHFKTDDPGEVFHNHIVTGFMTAFAAYLSGLIGMRSKGVKRYGFLVILLFFSYQILFINTGRTGYFIYLVLMMFLCTEIFSWRQALVAVLVVGLSFGVVCYKSPVLLNGLSEIARNMQQFKSGETNTSVGYRIQFHRYAKTLFLSSPIWGHGTGSFASSFERDNPVPAWTSTHLLDPHSQYWLIASEFGVLGLGVLAGLFISLWRASLRMKRMQAVMKGLLAAFLLGNCTDSLLLYSVVGYLFVIFSALCLGEILQSAQHHRNVGPGMR